jgi:hypothetical protein
MRKTMDKCLVPDCGDCVKNKRGEKFCEDASRSDANQYPARKDEEKSAQASTLQQQ